MKSRKTSSECRLVYFDTIETLVDFSRVDDKVVGIINAKVRQHVEIQWRETGMRAGSLADPRERLTWKNKGNVLFQYAKCVDPMSIMTRFSFENISSAM